MRKFHWLNFTSMWLDRQFALFNILRASIVSLLSLLSIQSVFGEATHLKNSPFIETKVHLKNSKAYADITPGLGGRLLSYGMKQKGSIIKLGQDYYQKTPPNISPFAQNIGYLGHIVWIGPQAEWWTRQTLNSERKSNKAQWPPDPYLIFSENRISEKRNNFLRLEGPLSPITGLSIDKTFSLEANSTALHVTATAKNLQPSLSPWDLWFNTRLFPDSVVYLPIKDDKQHLRVEHLNADTNGALEIIYDGKTLSLKASTPPRSKSGRQGKLFVQPSKGWMAAFRGEQLFIITFPLAAADSILKGQAQVEVYANFPRDLHNGLIEMELHAPAKQAHAKQTWFLFEYKGKNQRKNQLDFLQRTLQQVLVRSPADKEH